MTVPTSPNPSAEVQQSFADLLALEKHAREMIVPPLHRLNSPIINFSSYRKSMLFFYGIADPTSFYLSIIFASDGRLQRKRTELPTFMKAVFLFLIIVMFNLTLSSKLFETAEETIKTFSGGATPWENHITWWVFIFWLVMISAQVVNWCRFVLNKKYLAPRLIAIALFVGFLFLLPEIDETLKWLKNVLTLNVLDSYKLDYFFFLLEIFAVLSFWFWVFVKTGYWSFVLLAYLIYIIAQLTKTGISEEVKSLLQPIQLGEGRVFSLDGMQPGQLRSAQEWTKTRIEAINYQFVSIGAFLALFTLFSTIPTGQGWVDQLVKLIKGPWVRQEELGFGEQVLGLILLLLIIGFVALLFHYWRSIVALNLIREACILTQFATSPTPQPQPALPVESRPQPWYKISLIFLLTSLVFLFTTIIKDRRSK